MTDEGKEYLALAKEYREKHDATPWYKIMKRRYYKRMAESALDYIVRYCK